MCAFGGTVTDLGATILDADGLRLSAEEKRFFRDARPFGFILFARNIDTPDQVRALCDDMREAAGHDAMITIDQEGGRVQRLRAPHWREWLPPLDHVRAAGRAAQRAMFLRYRIIAAELNALGIDSNCAPMADIAFAQTHPFLRNRCYGTDAGEVAALARAASDAMLEGGVLPVLKHIPGHGRATSDSHYDLPRVSATTEDLRATDFAAFAALRDLPLGMTAHVVYEAFSDAPATLCATTLEAVRKDIGFDGLIMTDDISMKALSGDLGTLSQQALGAGCDVILHCNGTLAERRAVAEAAGTLAPDAKRRADAALAARVVPADVDIESLEAQLGALLGEGSHG